MHNLLSCMHLQHLTPCPYISCLTGSGTSPDLWIRADLTAWKMSTTPSVLRRSSCEWMAMKVPVLPTPSL